MTLQECSVAEMLVTRGCGSAALPLIECLIAVNETAGPMKHVKMNFFYAIFHITYYCIEGKFGGWKFDLTNYHKFTKVSSAKISCLILNNIINIQIRQSLCHVFLQLIH